MTLASGRDDLAPLVLDALRVRDYRRFWCGSLVSNLGLWIHTIALGWLVYDLTRSASWLGTVSFAGNLPTFALGLVGGAIADRASRRAIMMASLVGPEHLFGAISLNSVQFNLARAAGPALAGLLYQPIGPAGCFALNACGFLGMVAVVSRLRLPPRPADPPPPIVRALREGLRYVRRHRVIGPAIFLAAVMSLFGFPYIIMLPAVAHDTLHLDATGLGWLMACVGGGAVVGGLGMSAVGHRTPGGRTAVLGAAAFGLVLSTFAAVGTMAQAMLVLFLLGALQTVAIASMTTSIQLAVHDGMRGRVMSMITVIFFGFSTLGGLVAGVIGDRVGVPWALASGGVITAIVALVLARSAAFA